MGNDHQMWFARRVLEQREHAQRSLVAHLVQHVQGVQHVQEVQRDRQVLPVHQIPSDCTWKWVAAIGHLADRHQVD